MSNSVIHFVGLDVHKESIAVSNRRDSATLARLFRAGKLPGIYVPTKLKLECQSLELSENACLEFRLQVASRADRLKAGLITS